jgi:FtsP/CotA-like multicopper oxidase with cupredoxin domain
MRKMRHRFTKLVLFIAVALVALIPIGPNGHAGAETPVVKKFQLYATDGYLTLPDGKQVYIWGYSLKNEQGSASYPGPTLEVNEGDQVEVTLTNIGPLKKGIKRLAHTIHWHGMDTDQKNDGVPHTSPAIQVGESFTYHFMAKHAGTYFYHCHVDTVEHLQMGMHGALIVNAKDGVKQAWTGGPSYDKEYVFEFNEIDPVWHKAVEEGKPYDRTVFHPTYWTINGKAYPDTEQDPTTMIEGKVGQTVLIRMINSGYQPHSIHFHGFHFQIIASDGRPLPEPMTKDTVLIGPGERYDVLVTFDQDGMFPLHSHNIIDNTNNGVYPGGLHTMMDVKPDTGSTTVKSIKMKTGQKTADVNGETVKLPVAPVEQKGTTYVPLRMIADQLGATLKVQNDQSIMYTTADTFVQLWLNQKQAKIEGRVNSIVAAPKKIGGSVVVPYQLVHTLFGAKVDLDSKSGQILITAEVKDAMPAMPDDHMDHTGQTGDSSGTAPGGTSDNPLVEISHSAFQPAKLTIKKGQTVKWVNNDSQIHTVYDLGEAFTSKILLNKDEFTYTFDKAGTYTYYCSTHPTMQGEITVTE